MVAADGAAFAVGVELGGAAGIISGDSWIPLVDVDGSPLTFSRLMRSWDAYWPALLAARSGKNSVPLAGVRLAPPAIETANIVGALANFRNPGREGPRPERPMFFLKSRHAVIGPGESVRAVPGPDGKVDWEGELAALIKDDVDSVPVEQALTHVAAYTIINDITDRAAGRWGPQSTPDYFASKSRATFAPLGPWLVPAAFIPDPQDLHIELSVNGEVKQSASTAGMLFSVAELIAIASRLSPLRAGDIIATGTPPGTGTQLGHFLQPGDQVRISIDRIGVLEHGVI